MCGITGWVAFDRDLTREQDTIHTMTATMACRGPDDAGSWFSQHAALGHRRLAVIDIKGGTQPMLASTPAGPVVLVYSGETYNYAELRQLHLTRFVRILLDRKDRMSMAVGLEVRVPFCDHRLVEYVYNTPWSLKSYDGREKSLLRGAVRDVLPESVVQRVKSPYPQTQDAQYPAALQQQAKEQLAQPGHPVFELVSHEWLTSAVQADPVSIPMRVRNGLERALDLAMWLDIYRPDLRLP